MNRWSMERMAASSGLAFAVLLIVSGFLPGSPKKWNASAADIQSYLQGKHKELVASMILSGMAYIALLWFLGSFAGMFRNSSMSSANMRTSRIASRSPLIP